MNREDLDAYLKTFGVDISYLSKDAIFAIGRADAAKVKGLLSAYFSRFQSAEAALMFDHDAGGWVISQLEWKSPIPLDQYVDAPDNRKDGVLRNAPAVLARLLTTGVDWDGTQVVADDQAYRDEELVTRSARGQFLIKTGRYPQAEDDFVLYASVRGGIDLRFVKPDFGQPKVTLQGWLNNQKLNDK